MQQTVYTELQSGVYPSTPKIKLSYLLKDTVVEAGYKISLIILFI